MLAFVLVKSDEHFVFVNVFEKFEFSLSVYLINNECIYTNMKTKTK